MTGGLRVDRARYQRDLEHITGARPTDSDHWREIQQFCARRLDGLGFTVERHRYGTGVNVVGRKSGTRAPDEQVLVSAHYDSVPDCPGADDNATGVAGALEVARLLAAQKHDRTLVVALWDEEERGLVGSRAYALRARVRRERIVAAYVFEMIGYCNSTANSQRLPPNFDLIFPQQVRQISERHHRGDFIAIVSDCCAESVKAVSYFEFAAVGSGLPVVVLPLTDAQRSNPLFADLRRSDHAALWSADYPAVMITDTAEYRNANYHCNQGPDTVDQLDADFAAQVIGATAASALNLLEL